MIKFEEVSSSQPEYAGEVSSYVFGQGNAITTAAPVFQQSHPTTEVLTPSTLHMLEQSAYTTHSTEFPGTSQHQTAPVMSTTASWQYEPAAKRMCLSSQFADGAQSSGYAMQPQNLSVSHDDLEKRKIRRERNKIAAAKCRQRRVDLTNQLQNETDELDAEKHRFMDEIKDLQREKEQLEFVLQAHRPMCKMEKIPLADRPMDLKVYPRSRTASNCSNTSTEGPTCSTSRDARQEFDLHTPVFNDKTPHSAAKKSATLFFKEEPVELNTPTWSEASTAQSPLKQCGRNAASSGSSSNCDFSQAVAGSSCASELRKRSSSSSTTSESKSPVRTLLSL